jgi:hypothetical protein
MCICITAIELWDKTTVMPLFVGTNQKMHNGTKAEFNPNQYLQCKHSQ